MSVLIKGMEMPTNCRVCLLCAGQANTDYDVCVWCRADGKARDAYTRQDCPLVELPTSHGRLIDADALLSSLAHNLGIRSLEYLTSQERAIVSWIDAAPTIIPADDRDINVPIKEEGE